jgi:hypothetical protein
MCGMQTPTLCTVIRKKASIPPGEIEIKQINKIHNERKNYCFSGKYGLKSIRLIVVVLS